MLGALQLRPDDLDPHWLEDGDLRWLNRGAYDLTGPNCTRTLLYLRVLGTSELAKGRTGLPEARALFGPIPSQLRDKSSYASRLKELLAVRTSLYIALGDLGYEITVLYSLLSIVAHDKTATKRALQRARAPDLAAPFVHRRASNRCGYAKTRTFFHLYLFY